MWAGHSRGSKNADVENKSIDNIVHLIFPSRKSNIKWWYQNTTSAEQRDFLRWTRLIVLRPYLPVLLSIEK